MNAAPVAANPWLVLVVVTLSQMVGAMSNSVLSAIAPEIARALEVDASLIGYQVSLTFGAATWAAMSGGNAVVRWGAARVAQASLWSCAAGAALFALPHVACIVVGSILVGIGMGLNNPTAAHLLVRYTAGSRRNLMFSIKQTGVPMGAIVMALAAPVLAVTFGWRWSLLIVIVFVVPLSLIVLRHCALWSADDFGSAKPAAESFGGVPLVWRQGSLRWLGLMGGTFAGIQRCLATFTVVYLVAERDYGLVEAGVLLSLIQAGGIASRVCWGWLADRIGSGTAVLMIICGITLASLYALTQFDPDWPKPLIYLLFFILGIAVMGWNGVLHAEAASLSPPGKASIVAGATTFFVFGGVFIGPAAFAAAYAGIGSYATTYGLLVGATLVCIGLLACAQKAKRTEALRTKPQTQPQTERIR